MTAAREPSAVPGAATSELIDGLAGFALDPWRLGERPDLRAEATLRLLDAVGCAVFGSTLPHSQALVRALGDPVAGAGASVIGRPERVGAPVAALLNGALVSSFEIDDVGAYVHPGASVVAAALAAAEVAQAGGLGRRLIDAIVVGYEVTVRIAEAAGFAPEGVIGWHTPAFHGAIGGAAAAAHVLELDRADAMHALAMAADLAGGGLMHARFGADVKRSHTGRAAQTGLSAALMAREGLAGVLDVLEDPRWGYMRTITYTGDRDEQPDWAVAIASGLGDEFVGFDRIAYKYYPVTAKGQGIIDTVRALRAKHDLEPSDVAAITIGLTRMGAGQPANARPALDLRQVSFSYPYAAAIAIAHEAAPLTESGAVLAQWREGVNDGELLRLQQLVRVVVADDIEARNPYSMDSRVTVETTAGAVLEAETAFGEGAATPHAVRFRPLTSADVRAKFRNVTGVVTGEGRAAALERALDDLAGADTPQDVADALRV